MQKVDGISEQLDFSVIFPSRTKNGPVAKYAHEKNHIDHPERAWLMWFFALELNCYEKLWNANSVYRS